VKAEVPVTEGNRQPAGLAWRRGLYPVLLCVVVALLATRGITSEGTVSLQGDMPRYLMNGAYFYDVLRDLPVTNLIEYTYRYFARYPALSLGHHPLLVSWAVVPFYAVFGISVFSARLAIVTFSLVGMLAWYQVVRSLYDDRVGLFAALVLATTPFVVDFSRVVMSEMAALAAVLVAAYFLCRYVQTARRRDAIAFALAAALSVYGKHHCAFMLPIFLAYFVLRRGFRALLTRDILLVAVLVGLIVAPLIPLTLSLSPSNVGWVQRGLGGTRYTARNILYYPHELWRHHLTVPALLFCALGLLGSLWRRDRRIAFFVLWIVGFYVQITYIGAQDPRYAIYWIPPFSALAAASLTIVSSREARTVVAVALTVLIGYQFVVAAGREPTYAEGYEAAARYVLEHPKGESVLFSGNVDSGYFPFFVRKHDPNRRLIVLRADKTLVTSNLKRIFKENLTTPEEIHQMLQDFGVGYVVIEDMPYASPTLALLREELKGSDFVLRERIPFRTNGPELAGVDLAIYEYRNYRPANRDRPLQMYLPLVSKGVEVRFGDLLVPDRE
jgi:hypothetical protein